MRRVLYALLPATLAYVWFFGWGILVNAALAIAAALAAEALALRATDRPVRQGLLDASALVTAVLLAFAIPPLAPWWLPALGAILAIVLAKHLYGGLGYNPFNPAMVGYVVLLVSFPAEMTQWIPPQLEAFDYPRLPVWASLDYALTGALPAGLGIDALTQATPLDRVREGLGRMQTLQEIQVGPLFGTVGGSGWEWINGFIGLGGLYLIYRGVIRWHIPVALIGTLGAFALLLHAFDPGRFPSAGFHVFSGATLLGAFFIATDPVSAATTDRGRLFYGAGIGLLTYTIRTWGGYPDGIAFAVLLMNATVPLIDRYSRPRIYGRA